MRRRPARHRSARSERPRAASSRDASTVVLNRMRAMPQGCQLGSYDAATVKRPQPEPRLRLAQAGPVVGDLGLSGEQRAQLTFLLCNENTDDLSTQFGHPPRAHRRCV